MQILFVLCAFGVIWRWNPKLPNEESDVLVVGVETQDDEQPDNEDEIDEPPHTDNVT